MTEYAGSEGNLALIVCRPVEVAALRERRPDLPIPDPHKGSTVDKCGLCGQDVWIGPAQHELTVAKVGPERTLIIACILCAVDFASAANIDMNKDVHALTPKKVPLRFADGSIIRPEDQP